MSPGSANAPILHLITGANVIDGNGGANNIAVGSLAIEAVAGIALTVDVANLAARNTTGGAIDFGDTVAGSALTVGTVDGIAGIANAGGAVSV